MHVLTAQVTVGFAPSVRARGAVVQADLIRQVAAALDKVQHLDVRGLRFMLGQEYGVDAEGQLWLDASDNALFWSGWVLRSYFQCHKVSHTERTFHMAETTPVRHFDACILWFPPYNQPGI